MSPWGVAWSVIFKFLNLANSFYMVLYWAMARAVATGTPMGDVAQVKLALWVLFIFILMELFIWVPMIWPSGLV